MEEPAQNNARSPQWRHTGSGRKDAEFPGKVCWLLVQSQSSTCSWWTNQYTKYKVGGISTKSFTRGTALLVLRVILSIFTHA